MEGFHVLTLLGLLGFLKSGTVAEMVDHGTSKLEDNIPMTYPDDPVVILTNNATTSKESSPFMVLLPDDMGPSFNNTDSALNEVDGQFIGLGNVLVLSVNETMANSTDIDFPLNPKIEGDFIRKRRSPEDDVKEEEARDKRSPHHHHKMRGGGCGMACSMMMMMIPHAGGCGGGCGQPPPPPPSPCGQSPCGQPVYRPQPQPRRQCCPCAQQSHYPTMSGSQSSSQSSSYGYGKRKR